MILLPPGTRTVSASSSVTLACLQVYAVIQSTLERLTLIGVINVDVQEQALMLTQTVGEEIASMIRVQKSLEAEFQRLIELQHTMRHEPNKVKKEVRNQDKDHGSRMASECDVLSLSPGKNIYHF
jgi:phosphotransacetylase